MSWGAIQESSLFTVQCENWDKDTTPDPVYTVLYLSPYASHGTARWNWEKSGLDCLQHNSISSCRELERTVSLVLTQPLLQFSLSRFTNLGNCSSSNLCSPYTVCKQVISQWTAIWCSSSDLRHKMSCSILPACTLETCWQASSIKEA